MVLEHVTKRESQQLKTIRPADITSCEVAMHNAVLMKERHGRRNLQGSGQDGGHVGQRMDGGLLPEEAPVHSFLHAQNQDST